MRVMITGHRPKSIGGYQTPNPIEQWVRGTLRTVLTGLLARDPELEGVTGMALGTDTIFAEECLRLGIPFIAALPFIGQEGRWPEPSQNLYRILLKQAKKVVVVDEIASYHSDHFAGKMFARNKWLIEHSVLTVAVWDGSEEGGTGHTVASVRRKKDRKLLRLDPVLRTITSEEPVTDDFDVLDMFGEKSNET